MAESGEIIYNVRMFHSNSSLGISFDTNWGIFHIQRDPQRENVFILSLENPSAESQILGHYCSISDAISSVSMQRTGFAEWDQTPPQKLPHRVHNIACWNFEQKGGTFARAACS